MVSSKLILDIFELAFDGLNEKELIQKQIVFLTEGETKYTGAGLFASFIKNEEIYKYKTDFENVFFNGLEIINNSEGILADAIVHFKNGIIDYVEIWNKNGNDYPMKELNSYVISQVWIDESCKRTIIR